MSDEIRIPLPGSNIESKVAGVQVRVQNGELVILGVRNDRKIEYVGRSLDQTYFVWETSLEECKSKENKCDKLYIGKAGELRVADYFKSNPHQFWDGTSQEIFSLNGEQGDFIFPLDKNEAVEITYKEKTFKLEKIL